MNKPARHRLHRELREIVEDTEETMRGIELVQDRFTEFTYALVRLSILAEAHRRLTHIVDRLTAPPPAAPKPWRVGSDPWLRTEDHDDQT